MNAPERLNGSDATSRLIGLGFTKYEALAYLMLLDEHPATAYEISKRGGLTKGNVYTALVSLVRKGAVQPVSDAPLRYAPVEPQALFDGIARDTAGLCRDLTESLKSREGQRTVDYVWTLSGEARLHERIGEIVARTQQQVWIKAPSRLLEPHAAALRECVGRGASVVVIFFGRPEEKERLDLGPNAQVYLHEGSGEMLAVGRSQFVLAADWRETLIADFSAQPQGVYTRSEAVVFTSETMFRHEIYLAEIMGAFGTAIEGRFGKDLFTLRQRYLPPKLAGAVRQGRKRRTE